MNISIRYHITIPAFRFISYLVYLFLFFAASIPLFAIIIFARSVASSSIKNGASIGVSISQI